MSLSWIDRRISAQSGCIWIGFGLSLNLPDPLRASIAVNPIDCLIHPQILSCIFPGLEPLRRAWLDTELVDVALTTLLI